MLDCMISVRELIRLLGGPTVVAAKRRVTVSAVTNWAARDEVPGEHRVPMWRDAYEAGIDWTPPGAEGLTLAPRQEAA